MSRVDEEIRLGAGGTLNRPGVVAVGSGRGQWAFSILGGSAPWRALFSRKDGEGAKSAKISE